MKAWRAMAKSGANSLVGRVAPRSVQRGIFPLALVLVAHGAWAGDNPVEFLLQWGSSGVGAGQFSGPHGIEVDAEGNVYVADTGNHRVQKFTGGGAFLSQWGSLGSGAGQFNHPHGIAIGPQGNVYVAETGNNRVQKFTSEGLFLTMWGSFGDGDGQFRHTHGLAVDGDGNVFVADRNQNRIQKFTSDGVFITAWGRSGAGDGEFTSANGVAVDSQANVFVSDGSPRIQKFTNDGLFIASWGSAGAGAGQFDLPRGLSTDEAGNVYVADRDNHRMQKFTGVGDFVAAWGSSGVGAGQFNLPYAVRASGKELVYVADSGNNRVQKFRLNSDIFGDGFESGDTSFWSVTVPPRQLDPEAAAARRQILGDGRGCVDLCDRQTEADSFLGRSGVRRVAAAEPLAELLRCPRAGGPASPRAFSANRCASSLRPAKSRCREPSWCSHQSGSGAFSVLQVTPGR